MNTRIVRPSLAALLGAFGVQAALLAAPAFPGAQGWGRNAKGGGQNLDTKILFVTSLANSGPGTLREALMQSGPRIIVFKTGGIINLKSSISFREGNVTIAGQTAPGDGIILKSFPIRIGASNVILRGLRIRNGDGPGPVGDLRNSIQIGRVGPGGKLGTEQIHDITVDHCSFGWSMDETCEFWYGARNMTISNCIFSEALWYSQHPYTVKGSPYGGNPGHGYAMLLGNGPNEKISVLHNLFAHNERRNPWIKDNAKVELINNVVYNWGTEATGLWNTDAKARPVSADIIGNYYKVGPNTSKTGQGARGINLFRTAVPGSKFYIKGSIGPGRTSDSQDDWDTVEIGTGFDAAAFRSNTPIDGLASGFRPQSAQQAFERVLKNAGALPRDAADRRAVEHTRTGGGKKIDKLEEVGGYPAYAAGTYPTDSDNDGMPDAWEVSHGLNPRDGSDATKRSAGGSVYLNIEEYINSLLPGS